MGLGRFLINGGLVPEWRRDVKNGGTSFICSPGGLGEASDRLTVVHRPHDPESRSSDLVEGFSAGDDFPEDDAPAEDVALLAVIAACERRGNAAAERGALISSLLQREGGAIFA